MEARRVKIIAKVDRPHFTYDILSIFHKYDVGIIWMEVYSYIAYIKLHHIDPEIWEKMKREFEEVDGFQEVEEVDLIAFEERDIEMRRVLDIIPQGVTVLDRRGKIKYLNKYAAERIFKSTVNDITGKLINEYIKDEKLGSFLQQHQNIKPIINESIEVGNQNYLLNVNPLINEENIFSGYILAFDDINKLDGVINRYDNPITFKDIVGESNKMLDTINQAKLFAISDSPVLITGESGTGKELFARAIHNMSDRKNKPFIAINCAAMPDQLLESELFGYEHGSFTGGKKGGKAGIFEIADGGTVFLDEIGEMPPHLQAKLLRVLQEKKIRKIGSHKEISIDFRLLSATNKNLEEMVKNKKFRLDLLYRINIFTVKIPPLQERKEDLPILVEYFIKMHSKRYDKNIVGIQQEGMKKIIDYNWPGNVRELQNVLERAVALSTTKEILAKDIIFSSVIDDNGSVVTNSLKDSVANFEKKIIIESLKNNDSIRETARSLNVTHTLLINRMKKYNINKDELIN